MNKESPRQIARNELQLKAYKLRRGQSLMDKQKLIRLQRCRKLTRRASGNLWENILFTDEKLFTVEPPCNSKNDWVW